MFYTDKVFYVLIFTSPVKETASSCTLQPIKHMKIKGAIFRKYSDSLFTLFYSCVFLFFFLFNLREQGIETSTLVNTCQIIIHGALFQTVQRKPLRIQEPEFSTESSPWDIANCDTSKQQQLLFMSQSYHSGSQTCK